MINPHKLLYLGITPTFPKEAHKTVLGETLFLWDWQILYNLLIAKEIYCFVKHAILK